jgi:hypothetical protein
VLATREQVQAQTRRGFGEVPIRVPEGCRFHLTGHDPKRNQTIRKRLVGRPRAGLLPLLSQDQAIDYATCCPRFSLCGALANNKAAK